MNPRRLSPESVESADHILITDPEHAPGSDGTDLETEVDKPPITHHESGLAWTSRDQRGWPSSDYGSRGWALKSPGWWVSVSSAW